MHIPERPTPFNELFEKLTNNLPRILKQQISSSHGGKYLHWEQLKNFSPPGDLSIEEWWLGIKFARTQLYKYLPLKDKKGLCFKYVITDHILEMLHKIDSQTHGNVETEDGVINPHTSDRYLFNSIIEEAITSSQMEGASTTRQVAADMIRYGRQPRDNSEHMILNNYHAIKFIKNFIKKPLTPSLVLELHEIITKETLDNPEAAGRFQPPSEERVKVVDKETGEILHDPPPAVDLPKRIALMCQFASGEIDKTKFTHPIIMSIVLHFWLAYDHPFADGNGRTARALFYWSMLNKGYWLFEYISISRTLKKEKYKYEEAFLYSETDDNDLTYFITYQLEVIMRAIDELNVYFKKKTEQIKSVKKYLKENSRFNNRQVALLSHAIRHPGKEYTIKSHQTSHNIAYATARSDLFDLVDRNFLIHKKIDQKTSVFRSPSDIGERLKGA